MTKPVLTAKVLCYFEGYKEDMGLENWTCEVRTGAYSSFHTEYDAAANKVVYYFNDNDDVSLPVDDINYYVYMGLVRSVMKAMCVAYAEKNMNLYNQYWRIINTIADEAYELK